MNLLQKLVASARISDSLDFGINENVILKYATNEDQVWDGQVLENNCHLTFQKLNKKGDPIQESRFSSFNLNPTKDKKPTQSLLTQIEQLSEILTAMDPDVLDTFSISVSEIIESEANLIKKARGKKAKEFQKEIVDVFMEVVKPIIAAKPKLRLKVVTSWNGKYGNLPYSTPMIESMDIELKDSHLSISHQERLNSLKFQPNTVSSNGEMKSDNIVEAPKVNPSLKDL